MPTCGGGQRLAEHRGRIRTILITIPNPELTLGRSVERAVEDTRRIARRQLWIILDGGDDLSIVCGCPVWRNGPNVGDGWETAECSVRIPVEEVRSAGIMAKAVARWIGGQDGVDGALLIPVEHSSTLEFRRIPVVEDLAAHGTGCVDGRHCASHEELVWPDGKGKTAVSRREPRNELAQLGQIRCPLLRRNG